MLKYITSLFRKKEEAKVVDVAVSPKAKLAVELEAASVKANGFSHDQIVLIAAVWFNLDMSSKIYKLKNHGKYGQFFAIKGVYVTWGPEPGQVSDMALEMYDAAYETDFRLWLSVKCFDEWLEPVGRFKEPPASRMSKIE